MTPAQQRTVAILQENAARTAKRAFVARGSFYTFGTLFYRLQWLGFQQAAERQYRRARKEMGIE